MLSICITVRNSFIDQLLKRLNEQSELLNLPIEFCISESASEPHVQEFNRAKARFYKAKYFYQNKYMSHGSMKNQLAKNACGSYLLFIHGEMHITHRKYLELFVEVMQPGVVVYGGLSASGRKPCEEYQLHWHAMRTMLNHHSDQRNQHPYYHLSTNNFLIPRGLFLQHPMPDSDDIAGLLPYAFELKTNKIPVIHIDNPISTATFLSSKRFLAVSRRQMWQTALWIKKLTAKEKTQISISEYNHLKKLQKWKIVGLYKLLYRINANFLLTNIHHKKSAKLKSYRNFRRWTLLKLFTE